VLGTITTAIFVLRHGSTLSEAPVGVNCRPEEDAAGCVMAMLWLLQNCLDVADEMVDAAVAVKQRGLVLPAAKLLPQTVLAMNLCDNVPIIMPCNGISGACQFMA
jgi:hypothetical protein